MLKSIPWQIKILSVVTILLLVTAAFQQGTINGMNKNLKT